MTLLPPLPASVSESLVTAGEVNLRVLRAGGGRPLLLIPGWTCPADLFVHQLTGLADRFDVIAVDPRGHGGSDKPVDGNTFAQRGRDIAALIDALELDDVVLLGWSFGVLDALSYLEQHGTERITALVLADETPKVPADPSDPTEWGEAELTHDGIIALLRAIIDDREGFWTGYASYMIGTEDGTENPDVARIVELGLQTPQHVAVATAADGFASDYAATATGVSAEIPTLFLAREDWADDARRWTSVNLPTATFGTIPTHMGFVVDPDGFNAQVAAIATR